ncbi:hypothetical protein Hypma_000279 [Hypsizygus marmoreus]|uniref:Uncharacterized protein n=1 Tax=Hypsizygus marmoreus TaxID=39966 RepID=A0A369JGC2_HYPMA|nr:hypothetical protein Hypma_000279 [Hypsizygus marmoreus]
MPNNDGSRPDFDGKKMPIISVDKPALSGEPDFAYSRDCPSLSAFARHCLQLRQLGVFVDARTSEFNADARRAVHKDI